MTSPLVDMIRYHVVQSLGPRPAVYISGGIDSTIILHHVVEESPEEPLTYTADFGVDDGGITDAARRVAEHYSLSHQVIPVRNFVRTLPQILRLFDQPRYNLWPYWLARAAHRDMRKTIFIGEGADEHFGGYHDRDYLHGWAGQIEYVRKTYDIVHQYFELDLRVPFSDLDWREVIEYYEPSDKACLREAYRGIVPDFVLNQPPTPPAFVQYRATWERELKPHMPAVMENPSIEEVKRQLQLLVTRIWLAVHELDEVRKRDD